MWPNKDAPLVCRGCFATDVKLLNIHENNLAEKYVQLLGISLQDHFSQYLCVICKALLLKFSQFRESCHKVHDAFVTAATQGKYLTKDWLQELSRYHYKPKYTRTKCLSYIDWSEQPDVKLEDNELLEDLQEAAIEPQDFIFIKNDIDEVYDDKEPNTDAEENLVIIDPILKPKREKIKKKKIKKQIVKKEFGRKTKSADDLVKIADMHDFDVIFLSKDEQLAEVAERMNKKIRCTRAGYRKCEHCGKNVKGEEEINGHYKSFHDPSVGALQCDICFCRFKDRRRLNSHLRIHREKYCCRNCDFVAKGEACVRRHHAWHRGTKFSCQYCEQTFPKLTSCLSHTRLKHAAELPWCEICGESFIGEKGVQTHKKLAHKNVEAPKCVCADCGTRFLSEQALARHRRPRRCGLCSCVRCGDAFASLQLLKYHLVQVHGSGEQPLTADCAECGVRFHSTAALQRHAAACGAGAACVQCGEHFAAEPELAAHEAERHPASDAFRCDECDKVFTSVYYFRDHYSRGHHDKKCSLPSARARRARAAEGARRWTVSERRVTERGGRGAGERHAICEVCGKSFATVALLKYHQRLHSGEGLLSCSFCPKKFNVPVLLENHMRVHTGERPYKCTFCPKAFKTAVNFKRHHLVHSGLRKHICEICQKAFQTSSCVKAHIKTVHMKIPMPPRIRKPRVKNE
ncbi:zinc finger protein 879 [Amyelois transitella]|uniref:zinc finger protein 879 n=1 Tax=Amyelois transitella TaxID=680683 RepID=UPI00298F58D3|nr:zinc finger protein 879 [Amyelois transitella]